jgi:hypothetical protein
MPCKGGTTHAKGLTLRLVWFVQIHPEAEVDLG